MYCNLYTKKSSRPSKHRVENNNRKKNLICTVKVFFFFISSTFVRLFHIKKLFILGAQNKNRSLKQLLMSMSGQIVKNKRFTGTHGEKVRMIGVIQDR